MDCFSRAASAASADKQAVIDRAGRGLKFANGDAQARTKVQIILGLNEPPRNGEVPVDQ
jgi:hypothetical protein